MKVKRRRLELPRHNCHYPLKVARLPIPPSLRMMQKTFSVPRTGLEPARLSTLAPETSASTIPPPGHSYVFGQPAFLYALAGCGCKVSVFFSLFQNYLKKNRTSCPIFSFFHFYLPVFTRGTYQSSPGNIPIFPEKTPSYLPWKHTKLPRKLPIILETYRSKRHHIFTGKNTGAPRSFLPQNVSK